MAIQVFVNGVDRFCKLITIRVNKFVKVSRC